MKMCATSIKERKAKMFMHHNERAFEGQFENGKNVI